MRLAAVLTAALLCAASAASDELLLKDGTKIIGNIVGFEDGAFKVETPYGYAIVKKEKVTSIIITNGKPLAAPAAESKPPAAPPKKSVTPAPEAKRQAETTSAPPVASAPPPAPAKLTIREEIDGNRYVNHTYGFQMYKPPSWRLIADARKALPTAVVAMGTEDQSTLFIVGREPLRTQLEAHAQQTERHLREIYQNYESLAEKRTTVAGQAAIERRFRGVADERDWSAVLISFSRGNELFTILGMTTAGTDLIQIQENVIARTVASLEFLK
jgi:hypothetical protein